MGTMRWASPLDDPSYWTQLEPLPETSLNGAKAHNEAKVEGIPASWQPIDLTDPQYKIPPAPPDLLGLIYTGRRHLVSGPPESTKTVFAYICALQALRDGWKVAIIDFEMGATAAVLLLTELGATEDEVRAIHYVEPNEPPQGAMQHMIDAGIQLVIVDASASAFEIMGLDDNSRKDVERFARTWINPFWKAGVTTMLIDHVTKDTETRGKFTIGSERKLGSTDIHLNLEAVKSLSRGSSAIIKVHAHKDRPGFLTRPTATVLELSSDHNHQITWTTKDANPTDPEGDFRPTKLMERVSRHLEQLEEPASMTSLENDVQGKGEYIRQAAEALVHDGYATEQPGPKKARLFSSISPYREPKETTPSFTPSHPVPTPSWTETDDPVPAASPLTGGAGRSQPRQDDQKDANPVPSDWEQLREQFADELGDD